MKTAKEKIKTDNLGNVYIYVDDVEECFKEILDEIENAEEDCANLDWISKDQALAIIKNKSGFEK